MARLLEQRSDGYELFEIRRLEDLDLPHLVPMIDRAWAKDYAGQPREDFNEAVLRKQLRGRSWFAIVARSGNQPVGLEIALERTLRVGGSELRAFYVTAFSVDPEHRRRGLGRWVLEGVNRCAFEDDGADLIFSSFHDGHAGSPTVQSTFDRIDGWSVERFHASDVWNLRLNNLPGMAADAPRGRRIWFRDSDRRILVGEDLEENELPDLTAVDRWVRNRFDVSFAIGGSLREQYFDEDGDGSGCLFYRFPDGAEAFSCFNLLPLKRDDKTLLPVGQLQLVWGDVSDEQIRDVIRDSCDQLASRGCFAVNLVDMGLVPRELLLELGFAPLAGERMAFAVRGPSSATQRFSRVKGPFFLDFT